MKMKESMVKRSEEPMAKNIYPPKLPGESPKAYSAFQRFIAAGGGLRPETMAGEAGCSAVTLRKWYQKHHWLMRYQAMTAAQGEAVLQSARQKAERALAEWAERKEQLRATEWTLHLALVEAGQRALGLLGAVGCGEAVGFGLKAWPAGDGAGDGEHGGDRWGAGGAACGYRVETH